MNMLGTEIAAAALAGIVLASGCGTSGKNPTETMGGDGGASSSSTSSGGKQATLEPFSETTAALLVSFPTIVSLTDVAGNAGCALAASTDSSPPADAHQVIVSALALAGGDGSCNAGSFPINKDCGADPFPANDKTCAQYRRFVGGAIVETATAVSGSMTITNAAGLGGYCIVDVQLGFGASGTYSHTFGVKIEPSKAAPYCAPVPLN
jgi:hypothetical protein